MASDSRLGLGRAPYCCVLYGVKYIDLVSLAEAPFKVASDSHLAPFPAAQTTAVWAASGSHLDVSRAPKVVYGVKYIDLVSPAPF